MPRRGRKASAAPPPIAAQLVGRSPSVIDLGPSFDPAPTGEFRSIDIFSYDNNPNERLGDRVVLEFGANAAESFPAYVKALAGEALVNTKTKQKIWTSSLHATHVMGLTSIQISETDEEAICNVSASFHDPERIALALLQPGSWFSVVYTDGAGHCFEWYRFLVWDHSATDSKQGTTSVTGTDLLGRLHKYGQEDKVYRKDADHKNGWTAAQITKEACKLVKATPLIAYDSKHPFPFFRFQKATPYEQIVRAYSADHLYTKLRYRIRAEAGRIVVGLRSMNKNYTLKIQKVVLDQTAFDQLDVTEATSRQIVSDHNAQSVEYSASLDGYASRLQVRAASGFTNKGTQQAKKRFLTLNFTNVNAEFAMGPYMRTLDLENSGRDYTLKDIDRIGRNYLKQIQRRARTAQIEADGNPLVRAGDALFIEDHGTGLVGYFFCQKVTHNVSGQYHGMTVELTETVKTPLVAPNPEDTFDPLNPTGTPTAGTGVTKLNGVPWVHPLLTHDYTIGNTPSVHSSGRFLVKPDDSFTNKDMGGWPSNWAFDMYAPVGTPVYAPIAGTVKYVEDRGPRHPGSPGINGWAVVIDSGFGLAVCLMHITKPSLKVGDKVSIGQKVSTITSWSAPKDGNPHCHCSAGPSWEAQAIDRNHPSQAQFKAALDKSKGKGVPTQTVTPSPTSRQDPPETDPVTTGGGGAKADRFAKKLDAVYTAYRNGNSTPMAGLGSAYVTAGIKYKIDPAFVAARAILESTGGTALCAPYNPFGQKEKKALGGGWKSFASFAEAIDYVTMNLSINENFLAAPNDVSGQLHKYNATLTPTGLEQHIRYMKKMGSQATRVRGWTIADWTG